MGFWPGATPFDLSDGVASPALDDIVKGPAAALTAVALVVGARARESGWAARAAVAVASRWRGSREPVLVDLDLEHPALHSPAGVANEEGAADMIGFGLSVASVAQPSRSGFAVVPAGVYAPDPGAVLRSDAWTRVLLEAAAERQTLLAWVPAEADGMRAFVQRAGAVIVLAEEAEAGGVVQRVPHPYAVLAVLTPAPDRPVEAGDEEEPPAVAAAADAIVEDIAPADEPAVAAAADAIVDEAVTSAEQPAVAAAADSMVEQVAAAPETPVEAAAASAIVSAAAPPEARETDDVQELREPRRHERERTAASDAGVRLSDQEFEQIRLPTDRESRDALIADLRDRQRAARMAPPAPVDSDPVVPAASTVEVVLPASASEHAREMRVETAADDARLDTIDPGPPAPRRSRYRRPLAWTITLVLMLSVLAGAWRFLAGRLGWGVAVDGATEPAPAAGPPAQPVRAVQEVELPWVVAIEAHTDLARANNRVAALRNAALELPFHVAPLERENTLYYHVMAGPVQDSMRAVALRDTLLVRQLKTAATPNDVRFAPLAFLIGDYGTRAVAELQIEELLRLDIPSYLLLADAEDGYPLYRVYVGSYAAAGEADVGRMLLRAAGIRDSLVTRTGSIVP